MNNVSETGQVKNIWAYMLQMYHVYVYGHLWFSSY